MCVCVGGGGGWPDYTSVGMTDQKLCNLFTVIKAGQIYGPRDIKECEQSIYIYIN